jgi:aspartyl-tRNA(Asn)/glutamyl-tRNA(Gln) amidotransferase subunit A
MSVLLEAEKIVANQSSHLALNAFITPLRRNAGRWQDQVKDADLRWEQGMLSIERASFRLIIKETQNPD